MTMDPRALSLHRAFGDVAFPRRKPIDAAFAEPVPQRIDENRQFLGARHAFHLAQNVGLLSLQWLNMRCGECCDIDPETRIDQTELLPEQTEDAGGFTHGQGGRNSLRLHAAVAPEKTDLEALAPLPLGLEARTEHVQQPVRDPLQVFQRRDGFGKAQALDPGRRRTQKLDWLGGSAQRFVELRQKIGEAARKASPRQSLHIADGEKPELAKNCCGLGADAQPLDGQRSKKGR